MLSTEIKILYVEDDLSLSYVTIDNLTAAGYKVIHFDNGATALRALSSTSYDIAILDVMLPEVDGYSIAEAIRKHNKVVPILFLSAKSLKDDRIHGFKLGGDDYITKPFSIEELLLKIEVFLKRTKPQLFEESMIYTLGDFTFDYENLNLTIEGGETRVLTQKEADLLKYFNDNRGYVLKRNEILQDVWGSDDYFLGRSMDVFVSRLRKYLQNDPKLKIQNIHGVGFKFVVD